VTTSTPADPARPTPIRSRSLLMRWKATEPARLYLFGLLAAVCTVLAAVGVITQDLSAALTGLVSALLVAVPGAWAVRSSVFSPDTHVRAVVATATARDADGLTAGMAMLSARELGDGAA